MTPDHNMYDDQKKREFLPEKELKLLSRLGDEIDDEKLRRRKNGNIHTIWVENVKREDAMPP